METTRTVKEVIDYTKRQYGHLKVPVIQVIDDLKYMSNKTNIPVDELIKNNIKTANIGRPRNLPMLLRIEYNKPINVGDSIKFIFNDKTEYLGYVSSASIINGNYFVSSFTSKAKFEELSNDCVFDKLEISNKYKFVQDVIGYSNFGDWPEVKSLEDLEKIFDALLCVNKRN